MNLTRVDNKKLRKAVDKAAGHLDEALRALEPLLVLLPDAERATVPRARTDFPQAARKLAEASTEHPDVVAATEFDAAAVVEDLHNVEAIEALVPRVERLSRMIDDSRLVWLAEAFVPSLQLYGVAKVRAKTNPKLAQAIEPLADVFAPPRKKKSAPTK